MTGRASFAPGNRPPPTGAPGHHGIACSPLRQASRGARRCIPPLFAGLALLLLASCGGEEASPRTPARAAGGSGSEAAASPRDGTGSASEPPAAVAPLGPPSGSPSDPAAAKGPGSPGVAAARRVPVEIAPVSVRTVSYAINTVGSLRASEVIRVPARVAGVVEQIAFHEGTAVTPQTVLARIDPERYRLAATRAEAVYNQAEAVVREARSGLEKRRALRSKDLGWVTEEELSNWTAQVDQAVAAAEAVKAALDLARKDLADSEVRAEAAGVVNEKLVDTGQYVSAGTPIATMIDARRLKLAFKVAESESQRLTPDSPITFRVQGVPERSFSAKIYHIAEAADPATRMVEILAWVDNADGALHPGFFADITAETGATKASIVVPQTAVIATDQGFIGFVLLGEDRVEQRTLRLGLYGKEGTVEVLDGLAPGEPLIVRGANVLGPDSRVEVASRGPGE